MGLEIKGDGLCVNLLEGPHDLDLDGSINLLVSGIPETQHTYVEGGVGGLGQGEKQNNLDPNHIVRAEAGILGQG